jgi:ketosteroid isomerase-like protein
VDEEVRKYTIQRISLRVINVILSTGVNILNTSQLFFITISPFPLNNQTGRVSCPKAIMKLILTLSICAFIVSCSQEKTTDASPAEPESALRARIEKLDLAHAQAIFTGNARSLDTLMDDDVTVNHPTNRIVKEKKELMSMISKGVIRYNSFSRYPEQFLFYPGMVVVMGHETVIPAEGAPNALQTLTRRYTNVWMKNDDHWRLAFRHANNVCDTTQKQ